LQLTPDPVAVKEANKAKEIKASASNAEMASEAWQMASLAATRHRGQPKALEKAPWWASCHERAATRALSRLAEREFLALTCGSEDAWSESLKSAAKTRPAPRAIEDAPVRPLFEMIEAIEADEANDRVRKEFKALARRRKPEVSQIDVVDGRGGSSSSNAGRRRGAFSSRAGALEQKEPAQVVESDKDDDSDDLRVAEARANRGDIRDLLRREPFACARKDAKLAVMTGNMERNAGRLAVEGRNEELPARKTRAECVKEAYQRQRARWHLPPRGKHVGYMPQAHALGTGQGNLGALEDGTEGLRRSARRGPAQRQDGSLGTAFGGLPSFDDQPGFFGSGFASFG